MPKTLLLADDSVTIRKVVGISFANEDVSLVTVDNGDDAILKARQIKPDAILADVVMPGKSGYEVCEAVKADPELSHIPVLLLTGTFEAFDEDRARSAGAAGHVAKPFEASNLVGEVKRLFASAPPQPAAQTPAQAETQPTAPDPGARSPVESFDFDDGLDAPHAQAMETLLVSPGAGGDTGATDALELGEADMLSPQMPAGMPQAEGTVLMDANEQTGDDLAFGDLEPQLPSFDSQPQAAGLGEVATDFLAPDPEPAGASASTEDLMGNTAEELTPPPALEPFPAASPHTGHTGQDFDFEDTGSRDTLLAGDAGLAEATVLDPAGASGFDVSSSDLGDPLAAAPAQPMAERVSAGPAAAVLAGDLTRGEPDPILGEPLSGPAAAAPPPLEAAPFAHEPDADATLLATDLEVGSASPPAGTSELLAEIEPRVRKQLHDTLEKVAWESFSDVTEKIVRQALKKVEAVAWEVIPQLAETLVREEIRRMKRGSGDSE